MEKIKLFCIPYSGGSANVYFKWKKYLDDRIELCPVELAGRGSRIKEGFYDNADEAAKDISNFIISSLSGDENYAVLGHSMGSLLAFEAYHKLIEKGCRPPVHMFFSGRKAPQDMSEKTGYYLLDDEEFAEAVFAYGGSSREVFENEELAALFLPILRSDFKLAETYEYEDKYPKIACDITVINGSEDFSIIPDDVGLWEAQAGKTCGFAWVNGGHFFVTENMDETLEIIHKALKRSMGWS